MDKKQYIIIYWKETTSYHNKISIYENYRPLGNASIGKSKDMISLHMSNGTHHIPLTSIDYAEIRELTAEEYDEMIRYEFCDEPKISYYTLKGSE